MRSKEKAIYLLIGFALAVTVLLSLGAVNANEQGKYQIACTSRTAFVLDTTTGAVKAVWTEGGGSQLDKPFSALRSAPEP
jgi:hypothetical protein